MLSLFQALKALKIIALLINHLHDIESVICE